MMRRESAYSPSAKFPNLSLGPLDHGASIISCFSIVQYNLFEVRGSAGSSLTWAIHDIILDIRPDNLQNYNHVFLLSPDGSDLL